MNVTIHHQWVSLFTLHMDSKSQIFNYNDASFNNFDSNSEEIHYTPINLMIHNFFKAPKIINYDNTIYFIAPSQHFHRQGSFKDKHLKELNFPTLFYEQLQQLSKGFSY